MSTTEKAWLAGFIDGEGSIVYYMAGRNKSHKSWLISLGNTHLGSVEYCQKITGVGSVRLSKPAKGTHKAQWRWRVNPQREIAAIVRQILPYLVIKQEQASKFLSEFEDLP